MNVKRFTARTAREALAQVREALGEDAVVLSTKPSGDGVEVLALAPEGMARIQQAAAQVPVQRAAPPLLTAAEPAIPPAAKPRATTLAERIAARGERLDPRLEPQLDPRMHNRVEPRLDPTMTGALPFDASRSAALPEGSFEHSVERDVETLGMSTLTFQDYVRERMLKRRQAELAQPSSSVFDALRPPPAGRAAAPLATPPLRMVGPEGRRAVRHDDRHDDRPGDRYAEPARALAEAPPLRHAALRERIGNPPRREPPVLRDELRSAGTGQHDLLADSAAGAAYAMNATSATSATSAAYAANASHAQRNESMGELRGELRSVRALIEERFGMLAFMERLQRDPRQAGLSQQLFAAGLSPALVRKLVQSLPADAPDELVWASGVLARNLHTDEHEPALEDLDGVFALIGPTGVGKTTSTAKLAAAFATKHGAASLGLITLDAYRVAAHEQLRTYGRILGVPVHTAHDRASLEDLLELLAGKKLVLIDTAGMAQRDARTRELLEMLQHPSIRKLLVINAAAQGET
ncbi:MAG: flagellar biosynthesis protein FlhF, partial [Microbacteriaceae bacterium]|nr:flagellar biosynthesis protein FlhF [Burkholderiaceae bacterium]